MRRNIMMVATAALVVVGSAGLSAQGGQSGSSSGSPRDPGAQSGTPVQQGDTTTTSQGGTTTSQGGTTSSQGGTTTSQGGTTTPQGGTTTSQGGTTTTRQGGTTTSQGGTTTTRQGGTTSTTTSSQTGTTGASNYNGGGFGEQGSWFGSAFVGSNFAESSDDPSVNFGGAVGYLFRRAVGVEFAADFSPKFVLAELPLGENHVNSYMLNAVGAVPIGSTTTVQPFVSAGIGMITLRSDDAQFQGAGFNAVDDNQFAFNIGAGVMAFHSRWGVRGDIRYTRGVGNNQSAASGTSNIGPNGLDETGNFIVNNIDFWRANIGVAFRW